MTDRASVESGRGASPAVPLGVRFNAHKAGIEASKDLGRIEQIVADAARGGRYYENEARKEAHLAAQIERLRKSVLSSAANSAAADAIVAQAESERSDLQRVIVCVDFDSFFSSCEELDDPSLRGKPHAVGGGKNGVLSTSSYEARKYGVRSAMPLFIARRLCPQLVVVRPRFHRYVELSQLVASSVLKLYDPDFEMHGLDEAFLDMTAYIRTVNDNVSDAVDDLRKKVRDVTGGLTVSCGIASSRLLAKIGADINKPNGQTIMPSSREDVVSFMADLPLRKIPGIGKVTERILADAFLVRRVGDILDRRAALYQNVSRKMFRFLVRSALGISSSIVDGTSPHCRKGMSRERTFGPQSDPDILRQTARDLCERLADDISRKDGVDGGRCVTLKLKRANFQMKNRSRTLAAPVATAKELEEVVLALLHAELPCEARLLGVRLSELVGHSAGEADAGDCQQTRIDEFLTHSLDLEPENDGADLTLSSSSKLMHGENTRDPVAPAENTKLICPVCNRRSYLDATALAHHVEMCLSLQSSSQKRSLASVANSFCEYSTTKKHKKANIAHYFSGTSRKDDANCLDSCLQ